MTYREGYDAATERLWQNKKAVALQKIHNIRQAQDRQTKENPHRQKVRQRVKQTDDSQSNAKAQVTIK